VAADGRPEIRVNNTLPNMKKNEYNLQPRSFTKILVFLEKEPQLNRILNVNGKTKARIKIERRWQYCILRGKEFRNCPWQCTDALVIALLQDPVDQPNGSSACCIFFLFLGLFTI